MILLKRISLPVLFILLIFTFLNSCRKKENSETILITILEPAENNTIVSPGRFHLHIRVEAEQPLRWVKLNITNDNFIPIFGDLTFQPAGNTFEKELDFQVETEPVDSNVSYYFHVFAQDANNDKNKYRKIRLKNTPPHFQGILLFTENSVGLTTVLLHKNQTDSIFLQLKGEHLRSEYSIENGLFYVLQSQKPMLSAYRFDNLLLQWSYSPETTERLSDMVIDKAENTIYSGLTEGAVYGFNMQTGVIVFTTPFMQDTVPQHITVTKDFLFGEFMTRLNHHRLWITFYKKSGIILFRQTVSDSTVMIFSNEDENTISLVRNRNDGAYFVQYDASTNTVLSTDKIANNKALAACQLNHGDYMMASTNTLFHFNKDFSETVNCTLQAPVVYMVYDCLDNDLFLMEKHRLSKWEWPKCKLIEEQQYTQTLKDMQLIYSYEKR